MRRDIASLRGCYQLSVVSCYCGWYVVRGKGASRIGFHASRRSSPTPSNHTSPPAIRVVTKSVTFCTCGRCLFCLWDGRQRGLCSFRGTYPNCLYIYKLPYPKTRKLPPV